MTGVRVQVAAPSELDNLRRVMKSPAMAFHCLVAFLTSYVCTSLLVVSGVTHTRVCTIAMQVPKVNASADNLIISCRINGTCPTQLSCSNAAQGEKYLL